MIPAEPTARGKRRADHSGVPARATSVRRSRLAGPDPDVYGQVAPPSKSRISRELSSAITPFAMSRHRPTHGFTLIEIMVVVAIIGILISVALPSYIRWVKRAQSMEATMNIRRLFDSSVVYFGHEFADPTGQLLVAQFPTTTPMRPADIPRLRGVETNDWEDVPTWAALNFSLTDPHRFAYQYDSSGHACTGQFTCSAWADLDGDGLASTFVRFGSIFEMEIRGSAGLFQTRPLE